MFLVQWHSQNTVVENHKRTIQRETRFWKQMLDRIIGIMLTFALSNLSFRGHKKVVINSAGYHVNLLSLNFLQYDPVLEKMVG